MGIVERINGALGVRGGRGERNSIDWWLLNYLIPAATQFTYGNASYQVGGAGGVNQTWQQRSVKAVSGTFPGYMAALRRCPPAFAAELVRAMTLSQMRFMWRNGPESRTPRRKWTSSDLSPLEKPWPNGTTGQLVSLMEWHAGLTGNAYTVAQGNPKTNGRLRVLRPDWVGLLFGSASEPDDPMLAFDSEILCYVYQNGGFGSNYKPIIIMPQDMAHWTPIPDPEAPELGMSWLTPGVRDIEGDIAMTEHKIAYFQKGATPNLVIKGIPAANPQQFNDLVDAMEKSHTGFRNAWRTFYLTAGADVTIVGANLKDLDYKVVQGGGETRISMLSRVPAAVLQISEGLQGSSLNQTGFGMARRLFSDSWVFPSMQDLCAALSTVVKVPGDSELWFDEVDMPILREDAKDAALITQIKAQTIGALINNGYKPDEAVKAVVGLDLNQLVGKHTGLISVQLQPPGQEATDDSEPDDSGDGGAPALPAGATAPALPAPKKKGAAASRVNVELHMHMAPAVNNIAPAALPEITFEPHTHVDVKPTQVHVEPTPVHVEPTLSVPEPKPRKRKRTKSFTRDEGGVVTGATEIEEEL